jgi:hypothetical protein
MRERFGTKASFHFADNRHQNQITVRQAIIFGLGSLAAESDGYADRGTQDAASQLVRNLHRNSIPVS